jgi:RNA polymerase sigma factor (sigma-70 family)
VPVHRTARADRAAPYQPCDARGVYAEEDLASVLAAAAAGDQDAWRTLVHRYARLVWATALSFRLPTADAEDVSQTVWLLLARNIASIREPAAVGGWLVTTTRRESLRMTERRRREQPVDTGAALVDRADPQAPAIDEGLVRDELSSRVAAAIGRLSQRCQQLLRLRSLDPRPTNAEISAALDIPVGSVDYRFRQCARALIEIAGLNDE